MTSSFFPFYGIVSPENMTRLERVFEQICRDHYIEKGSQEAEDIARAAVSVASAGVSDETDLAAALTEFIKRRAGRGRV